MDDTGLILTARELADAYRPQHLPNGGGERTWQLILRTAHLEAWLIVWPPGTGIDLHDHGTSEGALAVVQGALTERVLWHEVGTPFLAERRLGEGRAVELPAGHVHAMTNDLGTTAVSVHVYSPRLTEMTYLRLEDDVAASAVAGGRSRR